MRQVPLRRGQRVQHVRKPAWGLGLVLEDETAQALGIFFEGHGVVVMDPQYADKLEIIEGPAAANALLDNLCLEVMRGKRPALTFAQALGNFLKVYPMGLRDARLLEEERNYKVLLHKYAQEILNPRTLQGLLAQGDADEICNRAAKFLRHKDLNLISQFEKIRIAEGLRNHPASLAFAQALTNWLNAVPTEETFIALAKALDQLGSATWPTLTSFRFFVFSQSDIFIKPVTLQKAAQVCGFELNYKPQLNWNTFTHAQDFYQYLRGRLVDLHPEDMIDVQNFIWTIDRSTTH